MEAPIVAISRLRMQTDGKGVTTLVCFHGCPLRCRYCINPFSFADDAKREVFTPRSLYDRVKLDALYFLATGGGVTFGGGEPLLYAPFLEEFRQICGESWHLCAETSLNVPSQQVEIAARCIDHFFVDCKDTDPEIYRSYTGRNNAAMLQNLQRLLELERKVQEQEELQRTIASLQQTLTAIPPEIIAEYNDPKSERKEPIAIE